MSMKNISSPYLLTLPCIFVCVCVHTHVYLYQRVCACVCPCVCCNVMGGSINNGPLLHTNIQHYSSVQLLALQAHRTVPQ
jgi:hypothetical protein